MLTSLFIIKIFENQNKISWWWSCRFIHVVDSNYTCLASVSMDSALKKDENYYLQVFLKEFKYIEKKVIRHINNNLSDFSSSDESDDSDEE